MLNLAHQPLKFSLDLLVAHVRVQHPLVDLNLLRRIPAVNVQCPCRRRQPRAPVRHLDLLECRVLAPSDLDNVRPGRLHTGVQRLQRLDEGRPDCIRRPLRVALRMRVETPEEPPRVVVDNPPHLHRRQAQLCRYAVRPRLELFPRSRLVAAVPLYNQGLKPLFLLP